MSAGEFDIQLQCRGGSRILIGIGRRLGYIGKTPGPSEADTV